MKKKPFEVTRSGLYQTRNHKVAAIYGRDVAGGWAGQVDHTTIRWGSSGRTDLICETPWDLVQRLGDLPVSAREPSATADEDATDETGISSRMIDKMLGVIAEGLTTDCRNVRQLVYCAYREARKIQKTYEVKA